MLIVAHDRLPDARCAPSGPAPSMTKEARPQSIEDSAALSRTCQCRPAPRIEGTRAPDQSPPQHDRDGHHKTAAVPEPPSAQVRRRPSPQATTNRGTLPNVATSDPGARSNPPPSPAAGATRPTIRNDPTFPSGTGQSLRALLHRYCRSITAPPSTATTLQPHSLSGGRLIWPNSEQVVSSPAANCLLPNGVFAPRALHARVSIRRTPLAVARDGPRDSMDHAHPAQFRPMR